MTASFGRGCTNSTIRDSATPQQRSATRLVSATRLARFCSRPDYGVPVLEVRGRPRRARTGVGERSGARAHAPAARSSAWINGSTPRRTLRSSHCQRPIAASFADCCSSSSTTLNDVARSTELDCRAVRHDELTVSLSCFPTTTSIRTRICPETRKARPAGNWGQWGRTRHQTVEVLHRHKLVEPLPFLECRERRRQNRSGDERQLAGAHIAPCGQP